MKLMTQELRKSLPGLYEQDGLGGEAVVSLKYFTPWANWTWYVTGYSDEEGLFFGLVDGLERELGYFTLAQLESIEGPVGLKIERDLYWVPKKLNEIFPTKYAKMDSVLFQGGSNV